MDQVGIPLFYDQRMSVYNKYIFNNQGFHRFKDNFEGGSFHWSWRDHRGLTPAGKDIDPVNGFAVFDVNPAKDCVFNSTHNECLKLIGGILSLPMQVTVRLDDFVSNDQTQAGLMLVKSPLGTGAMNYLYIARRRHDGLAVNGLAVGFDGVNVWASNAVTNSPVWLRMRIGGLSWSSHKVYYDYSIDGVTFINMFMTQIDFFSVWPTPAIFAANRCGGAGAPGNIIHAAFGEYEALPITPV